MIEAALTQLNDLAKPAREADRFALRDGALSGMADARWREAPQLLSLLREAIAERLAGETSRITFGIEIGTGSAKFYAMHWPRGQSGEPIVDVKLELPRLVQLRNPADDYPAQIEALAQLLPADFGWRIPPQNIDVNDPTRLLAGCPSGVANLICIYGTQGPRVAQRRDPRLVPPYVRVLSAAEEAKLLFDAIVPPEYAATPGTMAIEIGSGSTELILIDHARRKQTIAFAVGRESTAGLTDIVRGIKERDVARYAGAYVEGDAANASEFVAEAAAQPLGRLFMNPNRGSESFRRSIRRSGDAIDVAAIVDYADSTDKFAPKAAILGALARAFGFGVIHEGRKGGLKRGMAAFIASAAGM
ncbi:MAG: hypothetical protein GC190_16570 [Alphaproteobacteria bacterium]|nr:hypothetical protein [Alphaproteobacteria bacterium]